MRAGAKGLLLCALALGAVGCGPQSLEGSLTELLDLSYDSVEVGQGGGQVAVKFLKPRGSGEDVVLEVSADVSDLQLSPHVTIDLSEAGPNGQRGTVTRDVLNDPRTSFPGLFAGHLTLDQVPDESGKGVSGDFAVTFEEGIDFGCGRTAFGSFKGKVP